MIKKYLNRVAVFKKYGYDMMKAREFVLDKAGIKGGKVLEVGTGKGHTAIGLAKRGINFITIDLDKEALRSSRGLLKSLGLLKFAKIKKMNAEELCFKDEAFDHVISVNFIHHAKNPKKCIREMLRVAKKSVVIVDLNKRGEAIMEKVHRLDGNVHEKSKMPLFEMRDYLKKNSYQVKSYKDACQTVSIAKKG